MLGRTSSWFSSNNQQGRLGSTSTPVVGNLLQDIKLAEKLFAEDRIGEAYFLIKNIEDFSGRLDIHGQETVEQAMKSSEDVAKILSGGRQILQLLRSFSDEEVWSPWNSKLGPNQDVTLFVHRDEPEGQYFFKAEGYLHNCNLLQAAAAILENGLHQYWLPMCTHSRVLSSLSAYRRIVRTEFDFVLFKKSCISNIHAEVLPDGELLLSYLPVRESEDHLKYLPKDPKERMDLWGGILLQYTDNDDDGGDKKREGVNSSGGDGSNQEVIDELIDFTSRMKRRAAQRDSTQVPSAGQQQQQASQQGEDDDHMHGSFSSNSYGSAGGDGPSMAERASNSVPYFELDEISEIHEQLYQRQNSQAGVDSSNNGGGNGLMNRLFSSAHPLQQQQSDQQQQQPLSLSSSPFAKKITTQSKVKVQAIFKVDLLIDFIPDWIFNIGIRSIVSMFIPMLEQQASLFDPSQIHAHLLRENSVVYELIESRIRENTTKGGSNPRKASMTLPSPNSGASSAAGSISSSATAAASPAVRPSMVPTGSHNATSNAYINNSSNNGRVPVPTVAVRSPSVVNV